MYKKIQILIILTFVLNQGYGQQVYSKLFSNDFSLYNPAYVGMYEKINVLSYTALWYTTGDALYQKAGISEAFYRVAVNIPVKKYFSAFGVYYNHSQLNNGPINPKVNMGLNYSFKYDFGDNYSIAVGAGVAYHRTKIDFSDVIVPDLI
ncbi:MAG: type IX secretion system membrane protein PorP/SprF, partial [Bacteroidota bacterium]|nr:type IX secretion system membrane protein PorP/SprF [Bacteroidota bacterium]